ncbi:MAG: autorepressor SdpR family transcription factor [Syntrophomonadaceae bacterium]
MPLNLVFKALSDNTRREILRMLQEGDLTAGEISDRFNITRPSISHHLSLLKQANLVQDVRKGQNIVYSLNTTVFQEILGWIYQMMGLQGNTKGKNSVKEPIGKEMISDGKKQ